MRREMDLFFKSPPPVVIYLPVIGLTLFKDIPFCRYVIEIGIPFLAFAPVRILRVFVYCSEVGKIHVTIVRLLESLSIEYRQIKTQVITVANQIKDKYRMEPIALKRVKTLVTNSQFALVLYLTGCKGVSNFDDQPRSEVKQNQRITDYSLRSIVLFTKDFYIFFWELESLYWLFPKEAFLFIAYEQSFLFSEIPRRV